MQFDDMINGLSHSLENRLQNGLQHSLQNQIQNSLQNSLGAKFNPETHRLHHSLQSSLQSANLQQVLHPHHHGTVHSTIPSTSIPNHLSQSLVPPPSSLPMPLPPGGVSQILPTLPHHPEPVSTHPVAQSAQSIASNQPIGGSGQSPVSVAAAVQSGVQKIASANQMPEVQDNSNQIGLPCQDCGKVFKAKRNLDQHRNDFWNLKSKFSVKNFSPNFSKVFSDEHMIHHVMWAVMFVENYLHFVIHFENMSPGGIPVFLTYLVRFAHGNFSKNVSSVYYVLFIT